MARRDWSLGFTFCNVMVVLATVSFAASPRLSVIQPRGIQRGVEHIVTFNGSNLGDAEEILFYDEGFEVTKIEPNDKQATVTVRVAADCPLGEHVAQVRTRSGISDFRTFYVEALPRVDEKEPNTDFDQPQPIDMNVTVNGAIGNEDVDYYVVGAKQGQRLSAEVVAMRLSSAMFDPYVAILDGKRFELSANDDTPLAVQDAFASIVVPEDGKYIIEVRESAYGGGSNYRLHVGTFPRPTMAFPAGGKLGDEIEVTFLGDTAGPLKQQIALPETAHAEFGLFARDDGGIAPTPNIFRLFEHGNAVEVEPNNEIAQATPADLPLAFNGRIEMDGDVDCFKFTAKKGQAFDVECFARRIRSGLDPVMNLYHADGRGIAGNDDSRGPDSYLRFNVPDDGDYVVRVTDHLGKGASDFVYRIEFQPVKPALTLGIPRVERYGQYRQQIYVPRGNRFASLITANRANFAGELVLDTSQLPAGITLHAEPMAENLNVMPVVFEAAADAPLSGKLIELSARHADPNQSIRGSFVNRADYIVSAPGQSLYRWKDVRKLAIAVVDEVPFKLEIVQPQVPLVRDGEMKLKIVAQKGEGWDEQINVQFPFRSPGVSAASSVNIPKGQNEVLYPINANGKAQLKKWSVFALGSANVGGNAWVSSQLASLEVADAFVRFELQRTSCEQGQDAQVYCKLNHNAPFDGIAKARLLGLPPKVTANELDFDKDTQELTFAVTTDAASPVGKHNLLCQITITLNGEPIVSRAGGVQLQIDKPLPMEQPATEPTPQAQQQVADKPAVEKPPAKPLSRLEKLRLAAKKRREERARGGQGEGAN